MSPASRPVSLFDCLPRFLTIAVRLRAGRASFPRQNFFRTTLSCCAHSGLGSENPDCNSARGFPAAATRIARSAPPPSRCCAVPANRRHDEIPIILADLLPANSPAGFARAAAACSCAQCRRNPTSAAGFRPSCARRRPARPHSSHCPDCHSEIFKSDFSRGAEMIFSAARCAQTSASSSELLASRFAPCKPVQAASPTA